MDGVHQPQFEREVTTLVPFGLESAPDITPVSRQIIDELTRYEAAGTTIPEVLNTLADRRDRLEGEAYQTTHVVDMVHRIKDSGMEPVLKAALAGDEAEFIFDFVRSVREKRLDAVLDAALGGRSSDVKIGNQNRFRTIDELDKVILIVGQTGNVKTALEYVRDQSTPNVNTEAIAYREFSLEDGEVFDDLLTETDAPDTQENATVLFDQDRAERDAEYEDELLSSGPIILRNQPTNSRLEQIKNEFRAVAMGFGIAEISLEEAERRLDSDFFATVLDIHNCIARGEPVNAPPRIVKFYHEIFTDNTEAYDRMINMAIEYFTVKEQGRLALDAANAQE